MKKSMWGAIALLCLAVFAFMSPASAAGSDGFSIAVADVGVGLVPQVPSLDVAVQVTGERTCHAGVEIAPVSIAFDSSHTSHTSATPGGASPVIASAMHAGPGDDDDTGEDLRG